MELKIKLSPEKATEFIISNASNISMTLGAVALLVVVKIGSQNKLGFSISQQSNPVEKSFSTKPEAKTKAVNEFAPVAVSATRSPEIEKFIETYRKIAIAEMKKFQIPASISMAQAIIESGAGKSILANKNNNMFGIKCVLKAGANATCGKTHCTNHFDDSGKDFFRKYENKWESWREHSQFLTKDHYQSLFKAGKDYKIWAKGLRELGYATDPNYEKKLIDAIELYQLHQMDNL